MSYLNKKCIVQWLNPDDKWVTVSKSAKCVDVNGDFIKLAYFDKGLNAYDEKNAQWYDMLDTNFRFLWKE